MRLPSCSARGFGQSTARQMGGDNPPRPKARSICFRNRDKVSKRNLLTSWESKTREISEAIQISSSGQLHFMLCGVLFLFQCDPVGFRHGNLEDVNSCRPCMAIVMHGTVCTPFRRMLPSGRCQLHIHDASRVGIGDAISPLGLSGGHQDDCLCGAVIISHGKC